MTGTKAEARETAQDRILLSERIVAECVKKNYFARDCYSTTDKAGNALPPKAATKVAAKNIEEVDGDGVELSGIRICAVSAEAPGSSTDQTAVESTCRPCDPWQKGTDPWGRNGNTENQANITLGL